MENFLFIFRGGTTHISTAKSEAEMKVIQSWDEWMGGLAEAGLLAGGDALKGSGSRVQGSQKAVTDDLAAIDAEKIGGYLLVNAIDLNHAVEISKGCPILHEEGSVEVRPIQKRN